MSNFALKEDPSSRKVTRFLLVLEIIAATLVFGLRRLHFFFPALIISILALLLFLGVLFWLYGRYLETPVVRERDKIQRWQTKFEKSTQTQAGVIRAAEKERERLLRAEKEEIELALRAGQRQSAEGTLDYRIERQLESIQQKYQALQEQNGAAESKARSSQEILGYEIIAFRPRLKELTTYTFPKYLSQVLASGGMGTGALALLLVTVQVMSSMRGPGSATIPLEPTALSSPVVTATLLPTLAPSLTPTSTATALPTSTATVAATDTQTLVPQVTLPAAVASCIPHDTARQTGTVVGIVDGDTIDVRIDNQVVRVRYIGVNTPEQDQSLYSQATQYNQQLVQNKTVTLVKDVSDMDQFGRLLRYVIVGDTFVNRELVQAGYAASTAYPPDTACVGEFESTQRAAQTANAGLWLATAPAMVPPITGGESTPNCDPSYPGVCIPPAPPDLDCGDVSYRRFQVLPPDPHGFDRDGDGIGCES